jgi:hypothetical protein
MSGGPDGERGKKTVLFQLERGTARRESERLLEKMRCSSSDAPSFVMDAES